MVHRGVWSPVLHLGGIEHHLKPQSPYQQKTQKTPGVFCSSLQSPLHFDVRYSWYKLSHCWVIRRRKSQNSFIMNTFQLWAKEPAASDGLEPCGCASVLTQTRYRETASHDSGDTMLAALPRPLVPRLVLRSTWPLLPGRSTRFYRKFADCWSG